MYFPFLINLDGKAILVVGGGKVAYRKVLLFKKFSNDITIIAPELCSELEEEIKKSNFVYLKKYFENGDTFKFDVIIAATNSRDVNRLIYLESKKNNKLINVVDDPELCAFIVPSIISYENFLIAFSTFGKAPSLSRVFREELERDFDSSFNSIIGYLESLRESIKNKNYLPKEREKILLDCSRKAFKYFRRGKSLSEIKAMIESCN
ncbi:siroheme synthase [Thermodesulfobium acidiphilum]|uniref:precorrin-2 dehydrogenase n=1 Tax=Thermodesulfobium acidiphilum TaxID=1794699 RepID=A0A2R4W0A8_THEAF|nr:bifunctional precorrin-2 dehydrogenase/sirohydrochlorin ferrochelatase [Thermodesulfobium acidiphilum]AWB10237.1 siroheme synthase [Thermodesulfobium acidiphilum]